MAKARYLQDVNTEKMYPIGHTRAVYDDNGTLLEDRLKTNENDIKDKANLKHTHKTDDVENLQDSLDNKAELEHGHNIEDVTGLQTQLNNKASSGHSHSISDISNLQTTLNGKQATITGAASSIVTKNFGSGWALVSDSNGKVAESETTRTELEFLCGLQDSVQKQLDNKAASSHNHSNLTLTLNGSSSGSTYNGSSTASASWYAPTSAGTSGYELVSNGSGDPVWRKPPYYVCGTSAGIAAKVAPSSTVAENYFKKVEGARVLIKFTYAHTGSSAATLSVNGTGASTIYRHNGTSNVSVTASNGSWKAGEIVEFVFDGSNWIAIASDQGFVQKYALQDAMTSAAYNVIDNYSWSSSLLMSDIPHVLDDKLDKNFYANGFAGIEEVTLAIQEIPVSATIVVAAKDSRCRIKGFYRADYVCSGTNDQTTINDAIAALPSTGGKIILLEGTYNISAELGIWNKENITIQGMGDSTKFVRQGSSSFSMITIRNSKNFILSDFAIDGISPSYGIGLDVTFGNYNNQNMLIKNLTVSNAQKGITFYGCDYSTIAFCTFNNCNKGISLEYDRANIIVNNHMYESQEDGIYIGVSSGDNGIFGNHISRSNGYSSSQYSIRQTGGANNLISNNIIIGKNYIAHEVTTNTYINNKYQ